MATPVFIQELRSMVGTRPLWLSAAMAVVLDGEDRVLLGRRSDTGEWEIPGGIIEPGEEPAEAVARECLEETGVVTVPESLTAVTVSPEITYPNGDRVQYLEITFRCRLVGGEARVNDEESLDVAWFALGDLPELNEKTRRLIDHAASGAAGADFTVSCRNLSDLPDWLAGGDRRPVPDGRGLSGQLVIRRPGGARGGHRAARRQPTERFNLSRTRPPSVRMADRKYGDFS